MIPSVQVEPVTCKWARSRYVTGSRASFRDIGFVTTPFCLRQASATSLCTNPFLELEPSARRHLDSARNSRDKPRDMRMKQVGATYVCNTGRGRDTATYPYLEPQPSVTRKRARRSSAMPSRSGPEYRMGNRLGSMAFARAAGQRCNQDFTGRT